MPKQRLTARQRYDAAVTLRDEYAAKEQHHAQRVADLTEKGKDASKAIQSRDRAAKAKRRHQGRASALYLHAQRADAALAGIREPIAVEAIQETDKEQKRREKAEAKRRREIDEMRTRMERANVEWDERTAPGRRQLDTVTVVDKGKYGLRASVNHLNNCLRGEDRTDSRVLGWECFYKLQYKAQKYDIRGMSWTTPVQGSRPIEIPSTRADAQKKDDEIRGELGTFDHDLLIRVIVGEKRYRDIAGPDGDERLISGRFKQALDYVAYVFKVGPDPRRSSAA